MASSSCLSSMQDDLQEPQFSTLPDSILLSGLTVRMLVGVDNWERVKPQPVTIDVRVHTDVSQAGSSDHLPHSIHYGILTKELENHCTNERYRSLEALADGLAKVCIFICRAPRVTLRVQKPRSLLHAHSAGVEISRSASDFITSMDENAEKVYAPATGSSSASLTLEQINGLRLSPASVSATRDRVFVKDLMISTILGVNPWERVDKQFVKINFEVYSGLERLRQASILGGKSLVVPAPTVDVVTRPQNYRTIVRSITDFVGKSNYKTVESLATSIAMVAIGENRVERIRVRVDKPSAIMFADAAGVEVDRDRQFFEREMQSKEITKKNLSSSVGSIHGHNITIQSDGDWHVAAIALGSNMGDRINNIERAVQALGDAENCKLVDTSFLYETKPMYVSDQARFINGACRIATKLSPQELLRLCQSIEIDLGRDKRGVPIKGPRCIDLDILFYDRIELNTPDLILPHAGILEREFVLKPLIDILPDYRHPSNSRTISQLHSILVNSEGHVEEEMRRVISVKPTGELWKWGSRTFIMGIINITPDSFSDGGDNVKLQDAVKTAQRMVEEGVDMIDIGGMSTAPNTVEVTEKEEVARVVPVIEALRKAGMTIPISIDTFRAKVAHESLLAGANIINDVSAGARDGDMFTVARDHHCPIILMHMRGDSKTMNGMTHYANEDVVGVVRSELEARLEQALREGVRRWNIILDPGIGFAKDMRGNLQLLRDLALLQCSTSGSTSTKMYQRHSRSSSPAPEGADSATIPSLDALTPSYNLRNFPVLLGASRKKFIGTITGKTNTKDRMAGTAAACTAGILAGVDIIRVHDVKEMIDVAKTADAIARGSVSA
ncbi:hypothetical protein CBS101457_005794 [Exobasidium rhododendri]|nr:hypothetical protein CBS101457_005794 [Exobasidium rhododendri]